MPVKRLFPIISTVCVALAGVPAAAQSSGSSGTARFQQGYGGARAAATAPTTGSTRDANGNRLIVNGIIRSGASSYSSESSGAATAYAGAGASANGSAIGGSTAIGNQLNVVVQGNRNTVIVNSTQTNTGAINAGTALNGNINLP